MPSPAEPDADRAPGPSRLGAVVAFGRARTDRSRRWVTERLEAHRGRVAVDLPLLIWTKDRNAAGTLVGSAIAFRLFLFLLPFLVFLVGIAALASGQVDPDEVLDRTGIAGPLAEQIAAASNQSATAGSLAVASGFVGMVWAGRALGKVLVAASSLIWGLPVRVRASAKIVGGLVGIVTAVVFASVFSGWVRAEFGLTAAGLSFLPVLVFYAIAWVVMLAALPRSTPDPSVLVPGAVLIGATIAGLQALSQLLVAARIGRASALYGAIGITTATLSWFFVLGRIVVLAMAVNAATYERLGSLSHVLFRLPLLRALPPRSARVRAFFGLDDAVGGPPAER